MSAFFEHPAHPWRMGSGLYGDAQRLLRRKTPSEGLGAGAQPALFHNLAALRVDEAQRWEYLSPRSTPAVIRGCSLLTSIKGRSSFRLGL
jgi:hypothetical protein